jgi:hypothetical protein
MGSAVSSLRYSFFSLNRRYRFALSTSTGLSQAHYRSVFITGKVGKRFKIGTEYATVLREVTDQLNLKHEYEHLMLDVALFHPGHAWGKLRDGGTKCRRASESGFFDHTPV